MQLLGQSLSKSLLSLLTQFTTQSFTAAHNARLYGSERDLQNFRDLFIAHVLNVPEHDRRPIKRIDPRKSPFNQDSGLAIECLIVGRRAWILRQFDDVLLFGTLFLERNFPTTMARKPAAMIMRLIHGYAVDPGPQATLLVERSVPRETP